MTDVIFKADWLIPGHMILCKIISLENINKTPKLNTTKRKKNFPCYLKNSENILYDKRVITNKFNQFYTNIGHNLSKNIKMPRNKTFQNYLKHKYNNNVQFKNIPVLRSKD